MLSVLFFCAMFCLRCSAAHLVDRVELGDGLEADLLVWVFVRHISISVTRMEGLSILVIVLEATGAVTLIF